MFVKTIKKKKVYALRAEVATARTPGLVKLVFSRKTGFFECGHKFLYNVVNITRAVIGRCP